MLFFPDAETDAGCQNVQKKPCVIQTHKPFHKLHLRQRVGYSRLEYANGWHWNIKIHNAIPWIYTWQNNANVRHFLTSYTVDITGPDVSMETSFCCVTSVSRPNHPCATFTYLHSPRRIYEAFSTNIQRRDIKPFMNTDLLRSPLYLKLDYL